MRSVPLAVDRILVWSEARDGFAIAKHRPVFPHEIPSPSDLRRGKQPVAGRVQGIIVVRPVGRSIGGGRPDPAEVSMRVVDPGIDHSHPDPLPGPARGLHGGIPHCSKGIREVQAVVGNRIDRVDGGPAGQVEEAVAWDLNHNSIESLGELSQRGPTGRHNLGDRRRLPCPKAVYVGRLLGCRQPCADILRVATQSGQKGPLIEPHHRNDLGRDIPEGGVDLLHRVRHRWSAGFGTAPRRPRYRNPRQQCHPMMSPRHRKNGSGPDRSVVPTPVRTDLVEDGSLGNLPDPDTGSTRDGQPQAGHVRDFKVGCPFGTGSPRGGAAGHQPRRWRPPGWNSRGTPPRRRIRSTR